MDARKKLFKFRYLVIILLIIYALCFVPLPYIAYEPGSAEVISPMVSIEQENGSKDGVIMLTTVRATSTNVLKYIQGIVHPGIDIYKREAIYRKGESRSEYLQRQSYVMLNSQSNATIAAYHYLGLPYEIEASGVMIQSVNDQFPAAKVLKPGDELIGVEGQNVKSLAEVLELLQAKKVGDSVKLAIRRSGQEIKVETTLGDLAVLDESSNEPWPGLGVELAQLQDIVPEEPGHRVTITAGNIGGPSAGLMFALEIIDQLIPEDLTRGYRIAGTGEITPDGQVGRIGGVRHKIVAANREKADIFFTPEDNAKEAMEKAKQIGTDMKVVTVNTLQEAMDYLQQLPPR